MKLVFWIAELSIHFTDTLLALERMGYDVTIVIHDYLTNQRREMGWNLPYTGDCRIIKISSADETSKILAHSDSVNVFTGFRTPYDRMIVGAATKMNRHFGFHIESPHSDGLCIFIKRVVYTANLYKLSRCIDFVCTLGNVGVNWYHRCGIPNAILFPIGYSVAGLNAGASVESSSVAGKPVRIIFLGRFIPLKGIDLLLSALGKLKQLPWICDVVGGGPMKESLVAQCNDLGLLSRINIKPYVSHECVPELLGRYDILVLPSIHEGWGAVVNEALLAGTRVVCSSNCGAADLLVDDWRGRLFKSGNVSALRHVLSELIAEGPLLAEQRRRIITWAKCISGERIASYFSDILKHIYGSDPRPLPPWIKVGSSER